MFASRLAGHVRGPWLRSQTGSIIAYLPALPLSTAKSVALYLVVCACWDWSYTPLSRLP